MSDNYLIALSPLTLASLPDLIYLDISGNPWRCDCDSVWLLGWLSSEASGAQTPASARRLHHVTQCVCDTPSSLQGTNLIHALSNILQPFCQLSTRTYNTTFDVVTQTTIKTEVRSTNSDSEDSTGRGGGESGRTTQSGSTWATNGQTSAPNQAGFVSASAVKRHRGAQLDWILRQ